MRMKIGNTTFSKAAKELTLKEFKEKYRGKLNYDLEKAHKLVKKMK